MDMLAALLCGRIDFGSLREETAGLIIGEQRLLWLRTHHANINDNITHTAQPQSNTLSLRSLLRDSLSKLVLFLNQILYILHFIKI